MIPDNKEDEYIYSIFWVPSESETKVLRYRNTHLQEPLQKPNHFQLMELRAKTIRWKIRLGFPPTPFMWQEEYGQGWKVQHGEGTHVIAYCCISCDLH